MHRCSCVWAASAGSCGAFIESDDSQTWDEEEKAFIPTLHENFETKVGGAGAGGGPGRTRGSWGAVPTPTTLPPLR